MYLISIGCKVLVSLLGSYVNYVEDENNLMLREKLRRINWCRQGKMNIFGMMNCKITRRYFG